MRRHSTNDVHVGKWWPFIIKYLFPLQFTLLLLWTFYEVFHESAITFGTLLIQLLAVGMIAIWLNQWIGSKMERKEVEAIPWDQGD